MQHRFNHQFKAPFLAVALLATVSVVTSVNAQTKWDLPTAYPASSFQTENVQAFISEVDKATAGKLKIVLHANASLFKAPEIKRAVQGGQAQIGEIIFTNFSNEHPLFEMDSVPFLAPSYEAAFKLHKASQKSMEALLSKQGMKLLYAVPWPPQGIYVKKPITSAADLKGHKWRAYSPGTAKMGELMGANPVTIQFAELSQALATGGVDSLISSLATAYDTRIYEQITHYYDVQAWLPRNAVIVNQAAFDKLDKATQDALLKAAADAETRGWKISREKNAWYAEELKKKGMSIHQPSAQLAADMKKIGDTMLADWLKKAGSEGQTVVGAYRKM